MSKPLNKAKIDEGKTPDQKKQARDERGGSWERENYGMSSGASKIPEIQRFLHRAKLNQIKESPTPNLPKSESLDKNVIPFKPKSGVSPQSIQQNNQQLSPVKPQSAPAKVIQSHVAGVAVPKELHSFMRSGGAVPYDHPHRELAAKFVTDVWRRNKPEGLRMSQSLLGFDAKGNPTPAGKPGYSTIKSEPVEKAGGTGPNLKSHIAKMLNRYYGPIQNKGITGVHTNKFNEKSGTSDLRYDATRAKSGIKNTLTQVASELFTSPFDAFSYHGDSKYQQAKSKLRNAGNAASHAEFSNQEAKKQINEVRAENAKIKPNLPKSEKDEYASPTPADVSAPVIHNTRRTNTGRHYISAPDMIVGYANGASPSGGPQPKEKQPMKKGELAKNLKKALTPKLEKANRFETHAGMGTKSANSNPAVAAVKAHIRAGSTKDKAAVQGVHQSTMMNSPGKSLAGSHVRSAAITPPARSQQLTSGAKAIHENKLSQLKAMPKPNLPKSEANPDQKADAQLGEKVENIVENHMMNNKEAERKEGHPMAKVDPKSHLPGTLLDKSCEPRMKLVEGLKKCYGSKLMKDSAVTNTSDTAEEKKAVRASNPPSTSSKPKQAKQTTIVTSSSSMTGLGKSEKHEHKLAYDALERITVGREAHPSKLKEADTDFDHLLQGKLHPERKKYWANEQRDHLANNPKIKKDEIDPKKYPALARARAAKLLRDELNRPHREKEEAERKIKEEAEVARRKAHEESLMPQNIKLDSPKYLTIDQHFDSVLNAKPNPIREKGQNTIHHIDDVKNLNEYHGRNIVRGVHDKPVSQWGTHTYLLHPTGQMEYMHTDADTSDSASSKRGQVS